MNMDQIEKLKAWSKSNPKLIFKIGSVLLLISFFLFIIEIINYEKTSVYNNQIPTIYRKSSEEIKKYEKENAKEKQILFEIVQEIKLLNEKKIKSKQDSMRMEYLIIKYKKYSKDEK